MKMKPFIFCLFFVGLCLCKEGRAQEYRGELNLMVSDAIPTTLTFGLFDDLGESIRAAFEGYTKETKDKSMPGMVSIGYVYRLNSWLAVGGDLGMSRFGSEVSMTSNDGPKPNELIDRNTTIFLLMPTGRFYYKQKPKVALYGSLGAGALFANKTERSGSLKETEKFSTFAFQINPIGVRVGNRFGGFGELGFGMKGFVTLGFSMKL